MKKGISLMVLVVTIIILSILAGIVVFSAKDAIDISKETNFKMNISKIQDAAVEYYVTRGELPVKKNTVALTKAQLLTKANLSIAALDTLSQSITSNGDNNSKFYVLDIQKLNVSKAVYDITKKSEVLYINDEGTHVYYITGFRVGEEIHFTLDT